MPKKFKPIVNDTTCYVQGRLSYAHLLEPKAPEGQEDKVYSCMVLIPADDKESAAAVKAAAEAAVKKGIATKWNNKKPRELRMPLRRIEDDDEKFEAFKGWYYFNCKANRAPAVLDRAKQPIMSHDEVYSGMWGVVCVNMYPFSVTGNNGVGVGLNAVLKTADDEQLGGGGNGAAAFNNIEIPDEDDDDDGLV